VLPGILELRIADQIQVEYYDAFPAKQCVIKLLSKYQGDNSRQMQFRGQLSISPSPLLASNSILTVTVNDFDLDRSTNPDSSQQWTSLLDFSTMVTISSCLPSTPSLCVPTGISKNVVLVETGGSTGQFTGQIQINRRAGNTTGLDGCSPGTIVQVFYTDATDGLVISSSVKISEPASVLISEPVVSAGGLVTVTVVDQDLAYLGYNSLSTVQVFTPPTATLADGAISQSLTLTETGKYTGYFTGVVKTTPLADLSLMASKWPSCISTYRPIRSVQRGDTLRATYSQGGPLPQNLSFFSVTTVQSGNIILSSRKPRFIPGESVVVTVIDADLNTNPYVAETASRMVTIYGEGWQCSPVVQGCVQVRIADGTFAYIGCAGFADSSQPCPQMRCISGSCNYSDFETVTLKEMSENSMNFTGTIVTSTNPASLTPGDGQLFADGGTLLHAVYLDAMPRGDMNEDYLAAQSEIALNIVEMDQNVAFAFNEPLTIKLVDAAANTNPCFFDTATVQITVLSALFPNSPRTANLQLQETSNASGIFTKTILTQSSQSNVSIVGNLISGSRPLWMTMDNNKEVIEFMFWQV
jgi:hypothetical protein